MNEGETEVSYEASELWWAKFDIVSQHPQLRLDHFVLDAREAFAPDGEYIGLGVAGTLPPFNFHFPLYFEILAPNEDLVDKLYDIILARNA